MPVNKSDNSCQIDICRCLVTCFLDISVSVTFDKKLISDCFERRFPLDGTTSILYHLGTWYRDEIKYVDFAPNISINLLRSHVH